VVEGGDKVALRPIKVDERIGDFYIVRDGLKPGERVVVEGLQRVRPGMQVKPVAKPSEPPAAKPAGKPGA